MCIRINTVGLTFQSSTRSHAQLIFCNVNLKSYGHFLDLGAQIALSRPHVENVEFPGKTNRAYYNKVHTYARPRLMKNIKQDARTRGGRHNYKHIKRNKNKYSAPPPPQNNHRLERAPCTCMPGGHHEQQTRHIQI